MINADLIKELNASKNGLDTDFRAEVVAVGLIKQGVDPKKILIVPNGVIGKSSSKDIERIHLKRLGEGADNYVYIITNRAGIYDTLPEGLFHKQYGYSQSNNVRSRVSKTRAEEKRARQFFLPFEILINRYGTSIAYREDVGAYENLEPIINQFAIGWPIFKLLDQRQSVLFLYTIPIIHQLRNNHERLSGFLSLLLGVNVNIILKTKTILRKVYSDLSLNESRLGVSSVLGGVSSETIPVIHVQVGPIEDKNLAVFISQSKNDILLNELFLWLFDPQIPIEKDLIVINKPKQRPATYYLGTNTFFS